MASAWRWRTLVSGRSSPSARRGFPAHAIGINGSIFAFAFGVTAVVGLLVGLIPARHASRGDLHVELQQASRRTAGTRRSTRSMLVVAEVALALGLLVSAGLLLHSLQRLFAIGPGFNPSHVLTMQVQASGRRFTAGVTNRFFDQALEAVRKVPGVVSAAFTSQLPLTGSRDMYGVRFERSPATQARAEYGAYRYAVSPGYFRAMGIPLQRGRLLDEYDGADAPLVVVTSRSLANRLPGIDPIGQRLRVGPENAPWATIVGIVGDVKQQSLAASESDAVYMTPVQWRLFVDKARWLAVRTRMADAAVVPAIKRAIWSIDKDQPIVEANTMDGLLAATAVERRFALILFEASALVALGLAAAGIYGVLSGSVAERTREIGVRLALGASRGDILQLVVRQVMVLTALGVLIGLCGAVAATRAIATLLFDVSRLDPATYAGVIALLVAASGIACWTPAWRAARIDPSITLRAE